MHNFWYLFKWKKDWYPEPGIYVIEDMLESIREKLGLNPEKVIRPRAFIIDDDIPPFIIRYEAEKLIRERKARENMFFTDSVGYSRNEWDVVKDAEGMELFQKSYYKAQVYHHQGRIIKLVITITSTTSDLTGTREYYFYEDGKTACFF